MSTSSHLSLEEIRRLDGVEDLQVFLRYTRRANIDEKAKACVARSLDSLQGISQAKTLWYLDLQMNIKEPDENYPVSRLAQKFALPEQELQDYVAERSLIFHVVNAVTEEAPAVLRRRNLWRSLARIAKLRRS